MVIDFITYQSSSLSSSLSSLSSWIITIGCGSGILAILGIKLGAKKAIAVDIGTNI